MTASSSPGSRARPPQPDPHGDAPLSIPPPGTVRIAALAVALEAVGLVVLAGVNLAGGLRHHAALAQLLAQVAYFLVLAAGLAMVASGLLRGRRWARSPAIVAAVVTVAIGMWLAFPSGELRPGLALIGLGGAVLALLVTPQANHWIRQFPTPFGLGRDDEVPGR